MNSDFGRNHSPISYFTRVYTPQSFWLSLWLQNKFLNGVFYYVATMHHNMHSWAKKYGSHTPSLETVLTRNVKAYIDLCNLTYRISYSLLHKHLRTTPATRSVENPEYEPWSVWLGYERDASSNQTIRQKLVSSFWGMEAIPEYILRCIGTCSYGIPIAQDRCLYQPSSTTSLPCFKKSCDDTMHDT